MSVPATVAEVERPLMIFGESTADDTEQSNVQRQAYSCSAASRLPSSYLLGMPAVYLILDACTSRMAELLAEAEAEADASPGRRTGPLLLLPKPRTSPHGHTYMR